MHARLPLVETFVAILDLDGKATDVPRLGLPNHNRESFFAQHDRHRLFETAKVEFFRYAPRNDDELDHVEEGPQTLSTELLAAFVRGGTNALDASLPKKL